MLIVLQTENFRIQIFSDKFANPTKATKSEKATKCVDLRTLKNIVHSVLLVWLKPEKYRTFGSAHLALKQNIVH